MITVGVDPGLTGAVAMLKDGEFLGMFDIPTVRRGDGVVKSEVDASGLYRELTSRLDPKEYCETVLERVSAMSGQGSSSVFSFGDTYGVCRAVLALSGHPMHLVTPMVWKKHFGLDRDKEKSRALAVRLFPKAELHLKKHADRAEALLMARFLWEKNFK